MPPLRLQTPAAQSVGVVYLRDATKDLYWLEQNGHWTKRVERAGGGIDYVYFDGVRL